MVRGRWRRAVSLCYYLQVLKQIHLVEPGPGTPILQTPILSQIATVLLALAVVVLGCAPTCVRASALSLGNSARISALLRAAIYFWPDGPAGSRWQRMATAPTTLAATKKLNGLNELQR